MSTNQTHHQKLGPLGLPAITEPWPAADIAYVACITPLFLAALVEWAMWILAFNYCLWCCFRKAGNWSTRIMSVIMALFFTAFRAIFLPIMVFTLPLPSRITQYYPNDVVVILQWFGFWSFAGLLTIPWLFCVFQLVTKTVGRKKKIKHTLDEFSAPKVVIVMPCYREKPEILLRTVDSIVDCEYPPSCMHVFLSFDGDDVGELYLSTIEALGVPVTMSKYPRSLDIVYRNCRITVSRFPHGGKRNCQKQTFKLIDRVYEEYLKRNDNLFVLFIDSDCILDRVCIQNFMYEMELKPGSKKNMLAMTGVITSTTEKNTVLTVLQDMEYIHGQLFERTVESGCGAVTCLPGALTVLRFSAFRKLAVEYFKDRSGQIEDVFDYGKAHLGEDRFLTHLFMVAAKEKYQIMMNTGAFCKTEAVMDFKSLLKQRRRWFLGFITNEACMITDIRLWRKYPILLLVRFAQNTIRTTALLFFILVLSLITTSQRVQNLPVGFLGLSLGLNWAMMLYFGFILGRYKIMLYPLMFILNPLFNWLYMVYGIATAGQRTWGGPRADAAKATPTTAPAEAIQNAEENGDDLNVDPSTFKQEVQRRKSLRGETYEPMSLQPSASLEGCFTQARPLPGGWYEHEGAASTLTLPEHFQRAPGTKQMSLQPRQSFDSTRSEETQHSNFNIANYAPRRVESFVSSKGYEMYQSNQAEILAAKPAGFETFDGARRYNQSYNPLEYRGHTAKVQFKVGCESCGSSMVSSGSSTPRAASPQNTPVSPVNYPRDAVPKVDVAFRAGSLRANRALAPPFIRLPIRSNLPGSGPSSPSGSAGRGYLSSSNSVRSPLGRTSFMRTSARDTHEPEELEMVSGPFAPVTDGEGGYFLTQDTSMEGNELVSPISPELAHAEYLNQDSVAAAPTDPPSHNPADIQHPLGSHPASSPRYSFVRQTAGIPGTADDVDGKRKGKKLKGDIDITFE